MAVHPPVRFAPRRLAHANVFVEDVAKSQAFYGQVCGLVEILPEPSLGAVFMGNGASHHDLALVEAPKRDLIGPDGHLLAKGGSVKPGLNHLAFEMDTERQLVDAYDRAVKAGVRIERTTDHNVAHSVYVRTPDGVILELFADTTSDWRSKFHKPGDGAMSVAWEPGASLPSTEARFRDGAPVWRSDAAPLHPRRIDHTGLTVSDVQESLTFMRDIIGLEVSEQGASPDKVGLAAKTGPAMVLTRGDQPVVNHIAFELEQPFGLDQLERAGVAIDDRRLEPHRHSIFLLDPDGMRVELFYDPRGREARRR